MTVTTNRLIRELLLQSLAVTTVVADRIYVGTIPQGAESPCIVLRTVWEEPEYIVGGMTNARSARIRVESIAKSAALADALSSAAGTALREIANQQVMVETTILTEGITIWQLGTRESDVGDDRLFHRVVIEFKARWLQ